MPLKLGVRVSSRMRTSHYLAMGLGSILPRASFEDHSAAAASALLDGAVRRNFGRGFVTPRAARRLRLSFSGLGFGPGFRRAPPLPRPAPMVPSAASIVAIASM